MLAWRLRSQGAFVINRQLVLAAGTGFLLMLGLGVLFPVLPYYRDLGLSEVQIGVLMSSYAFASVVMAPFWGRFSDRFGRKPALLIGLLGFSLGFGLFAIASGFWQWLGARLLGGVLAAAALPTIMSYTADVSEPERRNIALGTVGASIGLGVLLGPAFGGVLASSYGLAAPFFLTSAIGAFAALMVALLLPESLTPEIRELTRARREELRSAGLGRRRIAAGLAPFLSYSLLAQTSRTGLESTIGFLVADRLAGGPGQVGLLLAGVGAVAVLVQGGGLRGLARRFDDHALLRAGTGIQLLGLVGLTAAADWGWLATAAMLVGAGSALLTPTFTAELSRAAERIQGEAQGLNASAQSLGRAVGPLLFASLYQSAGGAVTYAVAGAVCALALGVAWRPLRSRLPDSSLGNVRGTLGS